jgi:hypothetical protein
VLCNLAFDVPVLFFYHINLTVKHIDVIIERVILLFSLDKSSNDFFSRRNTSSLLDLIKGIFDDFNITDVHIHQGLFFFVVCDPLV